MQDQIHLIRHGETAWSLTGQHTGVTELDLTARGEQQARGIAITLQRLSFRHVLTSPRLRARRTCELAGFSDRMRIDADLAEWDYGDYEGRRTVDIQIERPAWNIWIDGCPGGELPADVMARADRLIARLRALEGPVALFAHGQFGAALAMRWIDLPVAAGAHFALDPASLSILGCHARQPQRRLIALWNQTPGSCGAGGV